MWFMIIVKPVCRSSVLFLQCYAKVMEKIGLFYGSDTGNTETVAEMIRERIGADKVDVYDVYDCSKDDFMRYRNLILGLSTWHDGQLVSAYDEFIDEFKTIDFSGKRVAIFGLGDQFGYSHYFLDAVGIIAKIVLENGGVLIGEWPVEGYSYEHSKADRGDGFFYGLALDEDNQDDMTESRLNKWLSIVQPAFY